MASAPTIGIISAGAMGAGIAARLTASGCTVLTDLAGRSPATRKRAADAGMHDAPLSEICGRAQWILSILPPSDARALVEQFLDADLAQSKACFADCNAISPETTRGIAQLLAEKAPNVPYLDGGIIGGPPRGDYEPALYASADARWEAQLSSFGELRKWGLPVKLLPGAGVGGASAVKLSYAGIMKGMSGLLITMVLSAHADSPATAQALMDQLADSANGKWMLERSAFSLADSQQKAYRFVGEMEEIASFIDSGLGGPGQIFEGMAKLYARLADSVRKGEGDVDVLNDWIDKVKKTRE
ncbi:6-phosphogluconate dehydrogenase C-terminal domain-like protein [Auricularia subglabra TFB-10046 SS5]|nr:6-phosphogluconate dehydrogenase C-terminal domain-like protein [Auricularia subglabra TFB-10046 SS5]